MFILFLFLFLKFKAKFTRESGQTQYLFYQVPDPFVLCLCAFEEYTPADCCKRAHKQKYRRKYGKKNDVRAHKIAIM